MMGELKERGGDYRVINKQERRWISHELVPLEGHL